MTDNNVRIHLEPTPRHKHTLAAVTHCTTMIVWAGVDFLCRLPLVFISFDSFFLLSVLHCVCFFSSFLLGVDSFFVGIFHHVQYLFCAIVIKHATAVLCFRWFCEMGFCWTAFATIQRWGPQKRISLSLCYLVNSYVVRLSLHIRIRIIMCVVSCFAWTKLFYVYCFRYVCALAKAFALTYIMWAVSMQPNPTKRDRKIKRSEEKIGKVHFGFRLV